MLVVIMYFRSNYRIFSKMILLHSRSRQLSFDFPYQYMSVLTISFKYYTTKYLCTYLSSFLYASHLFFENYANIIMLHVGPAPLLYPWFPAEITNFIINY